ncbi:MAG: hypothetical protein MUC94_13735 [bacterium]|nr:hypothetical protein [bacterium]
MMELNTFEKVKLKSMPLSFSHDEKFRCHFLCFVGLSIVWDYDRVGCWVTAGEIFIGKKFCKLDREYFLTIYLDSRTKSLTLKS